MDVLATSRYVGFVEYVSIYNDDEHDNDDEHENQIAGNVDIVFSDEVINVIRRNVIGIIDF